MHHIDRLQFNFFIPFSFVDFFPLYTWLLLYLCMLRKWIFLAKQKNPKKRERKDLNRTPAESKSKSSVKRTPYDRLAKNLVCAQLHYNDEFVEFFPFIVQWAAKYHVSCHLHSNSLCMKQKKEETMKHRCLFRPLESSQD